MSDDLTSVRMLHFIPIKLCKLVRDTLVLGEERSLVNLEENILFYSLLSFSVFTFVFYLNPDHRIILDGLGIYL